MKINFRDGVNALSRKLPIFIRVCLSLSRNILAVMIISFSGSEYIYPVQLKFVNDLIHQPGKVSISLKEKKGI